MKLLLVLAILSIQSYAYRNAITLKDDENQIVICKYGYLVQIRTRIVFDRNVTIEQTYCESRSTWDNSCTHRPYKCIKDDK